MITITPLPPNKKYVWTGSLYDLIGGNFRSDRSAFIGTCGCETEEQLFLVNYNCIVQGSHPGTTWDGNMCDVQVIKFVDLDIFVKEQE